MFKYLVIFLFAPLLIHAQIITTIAGGGAMPPGTNDVPATAVTLSDPCGGVFDRYGNYYFTECAGGHRVRKIDAMGIITTVAGTGTQGYSGDGGPATAADLHGPSSVVVDSSGNLYISDASNFRIRKIDASGIIRTIAGNGSGGFGGDGLVATNASISNAPDIFLDAHGNLFIADFGNARVRKVNASGVISTFAGNGVISGYGGDGSRADTSTIGGVSSVVVDNYSNVYLSGNSDNRIFKVDPTGHIYTFAGTSLGYSYNGENVSATNAMIAPERIALDKYGNLFFGERLNARVRVVSHGLIATVVGDGHSGFSGDDGPATAAEVFFPSGATFDSCDNLYFPDANTNRVRKVTYPKCNYLATSNEETKLQAMRSTRTRSWTKSTSTTYKQTSSTS